MVLELIVSLVFFSLLCEGIFLFLAYETVHNRGFQS